MEDKGIYMHQQSASSVVELMNLSEQRNADTHGSRRPKRNLVTDQVRMKQISKNEARGMG
jgi:hypothetical protein